VGLIEVGCRDLRVTISRLALLIDVLLKVDSARVVVEVQGGWTEAD